MSSLSQFDAGYNPQQDRVLLRITNHQGEEFRLWLTRRICQSFLTDFKTRTSNFRISGEVGASAVADQESAILLAQLEQQAAVAHRNFNDRFEGGDTFPLGEEGMLVEKINLQPNGKGKGVHGLSLHDGSGQGLTIGVSADLFNSIFEVLERVVSQTGWGLELPPRADDPAAVLQ